MTPHRNPQVNPDYLERIKVFREYASEAVAFYGLKAGNINVQPAHSPSLNFTVSSERAIVLTLGPADSRPYLRRQAWHEVTHWKLDLEGYPVICESPPISALNWVKPDENRIINALSQKKQLSSKECIRLFQILNEFVADVAVSRTIRLTPVFLETIVALASYNANLPSMKRYTIGRVCARAIVKTVELEYSRLAMSEDGQIHEAATNLDRVEKRVLKQIFAIAPELKNMIENFRSFWIEVDFTEDHERVFNWVIEAANMIPEKCVQSFAQIE